MDVEGTQTWSYDEIDEIGSDRHEETLAKCGGPSSKLYLVSISIQ